MPRQTDYPIVLAHGICRFGVIDPGQAGNGQFGYFRNIGSALRERGFRVYHSRVSWAGGVRRRAADLRSELNRITEGFSLFPKVHVIAHSMGGLDARHMICRWKMQERVASLSTVSTPHWGSSFADWGIRHLGGLIKIAGTLGLDVRGFRDLTTERCRRFNEEADEFERANGVQYRTYAGVQIREKVAAALRFSYDVIEREEGENDGLVSLRSAKWRDDLFVRQIAADHTNEIGWWDLGDLDISLDLKAFQERIQGLYVEIAESL